MLAEDARAGSGGLAPTKTREEEREVYADRLEFEIDVIVAMGFPATS
jgi:DNA polymerase III alpha subunit